MTATPNRRGRKPARDRPLTPKQALFVAEYLVDQNGKQAAIRAGCSPRSAEVTASKWLRLAKVKAAVAQRLEKVLVKVDLRVEDVVFAIQRHIRADHHDLSEVLDADGNLRNPKRLTPDVAMNIGGFDIVKRNLTSGDGKVDEIIKVKVRDQSRYVEMGAKYFGILVDQLHVSGVADLEERVAAVRQQLATKQPAS